MCVEVGGWWQVTPRNEFQGSQRKSAEADWVVGGGELAVGKARWLAGGTGPGQTPPTPSCRQNQTLANDPANPWKLGRMAVAWPKLCFQAGRPVVDRTP